MKDCYRILGEIHIITLLGKEITFDVLDDLTLMSHDYNVNERISRLVLKPNLHMQLVSGTYYDFDILRRRTNSVMDYAMMITGDEKLIQELVAMATIIYSTDMAFFYNLPVEYATDRIFNKTPFKRVKDKTRILSDQKRGIFR